jgi:mono/diheme cytochrome c family protein
MSQNEQRIAANEEETEPRVGPANVPIWLLLLLGCMLYWGMNYLDGHAGGFNQEVFEPFDSYTQVAGIQPFDPKGHQLALGKATFEKTCILCHQANGLGKQDQFPPLVGSEWLLAPSPNRIGRIVLYGLSGPIQLNAGPGPVSINAAMAPLGESLHDDEVAAALTYVRQQWGNNAGPVTAEQITAIRAAVGNHGPWNQKDLEAVPLTDPTAK